MKKIILFEIVLLFIGTTFQGDNPTGWVQQTVPRPDLTIIDVQFLDSLTGFILKQKNYDTAFIYKTYDGGNSWVTTIFTNTYLASLQFTDFNIGYCVGRQNEFPLNGIIKKTTDGGVNWITVSQIYNTGFLNDVCFINKDTGFVCSDDFTSGGGLWRTINGGNNWQKQLGTEVAPKKIFFVDKNTGWAMDYQEWGLYKTTNCGINWFLQSGFASLNDVFFASPDTGWLIGMINNNENGKLRTTNGGFNWHTVNTPETAVETRLFFINNKIGWAGSGPHKIFGTIDGYNWGVQYSPLWTSFYVSFTDSLCGWAGCSGLAHTTDGGGQIVMGTGGKKEIVPGEYLLEQNYPNPFNSFTNIKFSVSKACKAEITVYNILGEKVAVVLDERKESGNYLVRLSAEGLSSGVYFYKLSINGIQISIKKMIVQK